MVGQHYGTSKRVFTPKALDLRAGRPWMVACFDDQEDGVVTCGRSEGSSSSRHEPSPMMVKGVFCMKRDRLSRSRVDWLRQWR